MDALKEYHFEIGPMDDSSRCVAIVGVEYSEVSEDEAFYAKEDVDAALAEKDAEIAQLKCDITDLRDDKKTTDAILDECNAKIAELQDKLRASEKQNKDLVSSASQATALQDKALANSAGAWTAIKKRFIGRSLGERKKGQ